jgi:hypothetical protein
MGDSATIILVVSSLAGNLFCGFSAYFGWASYRKSQSGPKGREGNAMKPLFPIMALILGGLLLIAMLIIGFKMWSHAESKSTEISQSTSDILPPPTSPTIKHDFNALYDAQSGELGNKIKPISEGSIAYQAWHEHAIVIWIKHPRSIICVVPKDADSGHTSFCEYDPIPAEPIYNTDSEKFRAMFPDLPEKKLPPFGSIAKHWLRDREKWRWVGYVDQECILAGPSYYWELSNGWIIGVFRLGRESSDGEIFSITNGGKSSVQRTVNASDSFPVPRAK